MVPPLAQTILTGMVKSTHDPRQEVEKPARRSISLPLLKIISHAIASQSEWSSYKKSLIWSLALVAWWGGFRIAELLPRLTSEFSVKDALLRSDVRDMGTSMDIWVRNPKVPSQFGDLIQLYAMTSAPAWDPVSNLRAFLSLREELFGPAPQMPVFLQENGQCLTKADFNMKLKLLLAPFTSLNPTGIHKFSGHSFRSGLATLLSTLGFTETQIKAWGRWLSRAYILYTKDKRTKLELQQSLSTVMQRVLSTSDV
jgi:hypothetical protein